MNGKIKVKKLDERAIIPSYGSEYAAGCDLYALLDKDLVIDPGQTILVRTGLAMEIPVGYAGMIFARSGLASKRGLAPANKVGVIDSDYRGEIIAQLVIMPFYKADFEEAEELSDTVRGAGGFGSTGSK